jgi:hypothetical protein
MAPQYDAIAGGTALRLPALQSPNFVVGVSGWIVRQDGTAEFNSGTFRGSIEVGPDPGQHFIVNNTATGDIIDVYDASNTLVFQIDGQGRLFDYSLSLPGSYVELNDGSVTLGDSFYTFVTGRTIQGPRFAQGPGVSIVSGTTAASPAAAVLEVISGAAGGESVTVTQRGNTGQVLQTDTGTAFNVNTLRHANSYSGTTDGSGNLVLAHGCSFTPAGMTMTVDASGTTNPNITGSNRSAVMGGTNFTTSWFVANTGGTYNTGIVRFHAEFFG